MTTADQLSKLMDSFWEFMKKENPLLATRSGDHRYNDQLGEQTEERISRIVQTSEEFLSKLQALDTSELDEANLLDFQIFDEKLRLDIERLGYGMYRIVIGPMGGIHTYFPILGQLVPLRTEQDFVNLLKRYEQMPTAIEESMEMMRQGMAHGQLPPKIILRGVVDGIRQQLAVDLDDSPYLSYFAKIPEGISQKRGQELMGRAIELVSDQIIPKFEEYAQFLEEEYIPNCTESISARDLPEGAAYYDHCITYYTSLKMTAEEIHEIGLSEVARIRSEMEQVMAQVDFQGELSDFFSYLREDPQFYPKTKQELLEKTAFVLKKIDGKLPEIFKTLPRLPYGIREIPEYEAPRSTTAYYRRGSGDGTKAGTYYINTYDLKSRPLYEIEALSLHEAVPGHHLQLALQQEVEVHPMRKFGSYTSFIEGWGLYAERLGLETGFYEDPYSNFGRLSYEMWRACRLVVDTGMHALGWSRQQAIDFMADNSSLTLLNITNEVDRYIGWPGQALAYKMGELKIRELRALAEERLGDSFDLRLFHDVVLLDGSLPLSVLEAKVKAWIENQL